MVRRFSKFTEPALLAFVTVLLLVPFSGRAFFVDDPLFVWTGQNIARHPLDPFGFGVNWYGLTQPMWVVTQNPPLTSYFIALAGTLFGFRETTLHLAFLVPAIAFVLGTRELAGSFVRRPLLPAFIALASPAFFVSATTVMSDVPMAAFLTWAGVFWVRGWKSTRSRDFLSAGLLLSLAFLTKYFAILILPVWILNGWARGRRPGRWLWGIAVPCVTAAAYEVCTAHLYGQGMFEQAMQYAKWAKSDGNIPLLQNLLEGLVFDGGCLLPLVFLAPSLWGKRLPWMGAAIPVILATLWFFGGPGNRANPMLTSLDDWTHGATLVQGGVLLFGGLSLVVLLVWALRLVMPVQRPEDIRDDGPLRPPLGLSHDLWFLIGWVVVTFIFGTELNWTLSARSTLPLIPPVAILGAMKLEARSLSFRAQWPPLALALLLTLVIAQGDWAQANSERHEAEVVQRVVVPKAHTVWSCGAWGLAYYLDLLGVPAFDSEQSKVHLNDYFVTATNTANTLIPEHCVPNGSFSTPLRALASTMNTRSRCGFYMNGWGQLPFSFFPAPGAETCTVWGIDLRKTRQSVTLGKRQK